MASLEGKRLASAKGTREGKELRHIITECSECDNLDPIATYCSTCGEFLCSECTKHHRRIRKTKAHVLVDVPKSGVACSSCDSDDMVKGFCPECTEFLCGECVKHHRRIRKTKHHALQDIDIRADNVQSVKSKQGQSVPIPKPLQTSCVSTPKTSSSAKVKSNKSSVTSGNSTSTYARATRSKEMPSSIKLVNKTRLAEWYCISKHVIPESCLINTYLYNTVKRLSYTGDAVVLDQPSAYKPRSLNDDNRSILTLSATRHVLVSAEGIRMCDNNRVISSQPHTDDWYLPERITFVNKQKFVTICIEQKKIRYHNCETLQVLSTHDLRSKTSKGINIHAYTFILCTNTGDILLQTGDRELCQFTAEGEIKCVVPVHKDLFECNKETVCIDMYNNIFGVELYCGNIHVFGLEGEHQVLVQIDYVGAVFSGAVFSAGVDELRNVYITYMDNSEDCYIIKYKY